ncbi:hypothetical protein L6452_42448 [Arctium lappa]|uniref:Uncharacterized protein n=1 Tax=Arctium lappa TaxID=4217 RepID=A0ACB8XI82_ARCLA|nr:hypothetical protein L6452_42448 [Arctium lappa]
MVFEEGLLLRIFESGSLQLKEKVSMAVEAITTNPDNEWAISAYDDVMILLDVCKSRSLTAQRRRTLIRWNNRSRHGIGDDSSEMRD